MKNIRVDSKLIELFFKSLIQSVLTFNLICYYANAKIAANKLLERPRKAAKRITGANLTSIEDLYQKNSLSEVKQIMHDPSHPLNEHFNYNRSGIRLCTPRTQRARFRRSFIPDSIHLFNSKAKRVSLLWTYHVNVSI